ncbi:formyltransferase family protein [Leptospira santarosai]|uniref:Methionyl-tRNA formyltransferase n=1 Tax=Leptospira santarosai TaxID=28183 RepID=A0AB73LWP8_9LEPT|nr:formyltransferase family protein [Leptospira santarosai]EKS08035.1 formyl transferase domain protein [Leptospira santarosai str. JET]EMO15869.1 formyl transferase domain protein [Leptospira santarosai str. CBC523]EMO84947.1 formyl transferase domain protein [Leptospira santarosai str. AIM]EPG82387.1 formyl transferase domain protein [Leptospira santarosai serovar Shermani str. 1342KT]MDI7207035.1 formyltransferase family protein [Leptospira santarosai]
MLITLLTDANSWINKRIPLLIKEINKRKHHVRHVHLIQEMSKGEICFILSFSRILNREFLLNHKHNLVVHESDLPKGKGWSPLTWQIIEGKNKIPICLFEANADSVDSGVIYLKDEIVVNNYDLIEELRDAQAMKTFEMCISFIDSYPEIVKKGKNQVGESSFYFKRSPKDSELDIDKTIRELFPLLRTVDNEEYPAFFRMHGKKYIFKIYKEESLE